MAPNHRSSREADLAQMQSLVKFTRARLGTEAQSPFGSSVVETDSGRLVASTQRRAPRERSLQSRRGARYACCLQTAQETQSCGTHALHDLRALPHVHGHGTVVGRGPSGLWSDHRRCDPALRPDPRVGPATRAALRHGLPRRWAGGSGQLRRPLRRPPHGYGHGALAEVTPEPGEAVGLPRLISAAPTSLSSVPIPA